MACELELVSKIVQAKMQCKSVCEWEDPFSQAQLKNILVSILFKDPHVGRDFPLNGPDATEDAAYSQNMATAASDVDAGSSLTFAKVSGPSWLNVAANGITSGTLYEKRFGISHHPVTSNMIQYAVGAAFCLPLAWATEDLHIAWNGEFVAVLAYLVLANSLLAMSLLLAMIRVGEVSRVSALFYLVPAFSALFAWPLLGEAMPPLAWAGMALADGTTLECRGGSDAASIDAASSWADRAAPAASGRWCQRRGG